MKHLPHAADLVARIFLAAIFLISGIGKIGGYAGTQAYMESAGVPGMLLPLVIALEIGGATALILGIQARLAALALAGFSLGAAVLFHANFGDQMQAILFWKNVGLAGGLLLISLHGTGAWSLSQLGRRPASQPAGA